MIDGSPVATRVLKDGTVLQEQGGQVSVKEWGRHGEPYEDMYAIRASIFLCELLPGDPEATERLRHWAVTHPDLRARAMLAGWLE